MAERGRPALDRPEHKTVNLYLDIDNVKTLKIYCIKNDISFSQLIDNLMEEFIKKNKLSEG